MNACSIGGIDTQNRTAWRSGLEELAACSLPQLLGKIAAVAK